MDDKTRKKALDDLKMLKGLPPHDSWSNICCGDGYFAQSLVRKYGMSISKLEKATGMDKMSKKYGKKKTQLAKEVFK